MRTFQRPTVPMWAICALLVLISLFGIAAAALAQQPSPAKIQGVIAEVEAQRTSLATRAAQLAGELAEAQEQAKAEIERLKKLCGEKCEEKKK